MHAHLQRDLGGTGAVAGIKGMTQTGQLGQAFRQFNYGFMRQAGQHYVVQAVQLVVQRSLDVGMAMAEQVDPPRTHRIQVTLAIRIKQPSSFATHNGHQGL